jgi:hypothetical protein
MGKLHELLAVEGDLKSQALRDAGQIKGLFQDGKGKLLGLTQTHQPLSENDEQLPPKVTLVATTVDEQLSILQKSFTKWTDASVQKEVTNQSTGSILEIGDKTFELPATALLNLEGKLTELRSVYQSIPTNDITVSWKFDEDTGHFVSDPPEIRRNTKKVKRTHVAYEATKEHPAQTETYSEDVLAAHTTITKRSGMITPSDKAFRLERLEYLIQAVKRARQRANDIEITKLEIGQQIFGFINGDIDK